MTTLKGIFPDSKSIKGKNFIHENVKNLRRIEHLHINKRIEEKSQSNKKKKLLVTITPITATVTIIIMIMFYQKLIQIFV